MNRRKVMIVIPALNAAPTLERTFPDIPPGTADKIILVDENALGARKGPPFERLQLREHGPETWQDAWKSALRDSGCSRLVVEFEMLYH